MMKSPRKRHRPEGEGRQPLAPSASTALESGVYQEGGGIGSGSPLPANVPLAKRSLEQETDVTDASVEQGERKRCKEHPTVPGSASSSCSSSGSESSTDTEMGLVDVCRILSENPETEGCRRGGQS